MKIFLALAFAVFFHGALRAAGTVAPVPAIPGYPESTFYSVTVNGRPVPVNDEQEFQTAAFCMDGTVSIEITALGQRRKKKWTVQPARHKIEPAVEGDTARFELAKPLKLVVKSGDGPKLALFATPLETGVPGPSDPNVIYFGPGVHEAGVIRPQSNQTVYLAPGALVKGRIEVRHAVDVAVRGRGTLDATGYSLRADKTHCVLFDRCARVTLEGIGIRGHSWWQTLFLLTKDGSASHLNIMGKEVNTDGIDIDGVQNFLARDCFIRCGDDGFGWHALDARANGEVVTDNATAEDCVIWNDVAGNGIRVGASMEAPLFQNITFRNIDILKNARAAIYSDHSDWAMCRNIRFENVTNEFGGKLIAFAIAKTHYSNNNGYKDERGHFDGLYFINVTAPKGTIELRGHDADHRIENVVFQDCSIGAERIDGLEDITVNEFVTGVSFKTSP